MKQIQGYSVKEQSMNKHLKITKIFQRELLKLVFYLKDCFIKKDDEIRELAESLRASRIKEQEEELLSLSFVNEAEQQHRDLLKLEETLRNLAGNFEEKLNKDQNDQRVEFEEKIRDLKEKS